MNLEKLTNREVNYHLLSLVENERKSTKEILKVINVVSNRKSYLEMGYANLFQFCVKFLKYSEAVTYQRIAAAELLNQIPEVGEKLDKGSLNITQLTHLKTAIKAQDKVQKVSLDSKKDILSKLENISGADTQKTLAQEFSSYQPKSKKEVHYKKDESVQISLTLTKAQHEKLERVKALLSHKVPDQNLTKVIEVLCDQEIQRRTEIKKNPKNKVQHQLKDLQGQVKNPLPIKNTSHTETDELTQGFAENKKSCVVHEKSKIVSDTDVKNPPSKARTAIPINLRKKIFQKYNFECQFKAKDHQCKSKHFLEIEHIKPIAFGGDNLPENLTLLCRNHNQHQARKLGLIP